MTIHRNTNGLKKHAENKSRNTKVKVEEGIKQLIKDHQTINFNSVSSATNVSKSYLYNEPDIRTRIEFLRDQTDQEQMLRPSKKPSVTDKSKDILLIAKNERIKQLEKENKELKEQVKKLRGQWYETFS